MSIRKLSKIAHTGFNKSKGCPNTPPEHLEQLDKLFQGLSDGQMPNFLQMMAALSEIAYEMTGDDGPCIDCKMG